MFQSLSARDKELQIQIGLDTLGDGNSFVARNISSFDPGNQSVQVMPTCIVICCITHTPAFAVLHGALLLLHVAPAMCCVRLEICRCWAEQSQLPAGVQQVLQSLQLESICAPLCSGASMYSCIG